MDRKLIKSDFCVKKCLSANTVKINQVDNDLPFYETHFPEIKEIPLAQTSMPLCPKCGISILDYSRDDMAALDLRNID